MDFLDILREKAFLGREFLTWLWFKCDQTGGRIDLRDGRTLECAFLDKMTLDLSDTDSPQSVTLKGEQSELREGLAALREGKKIEEARLSINTGFNEFTMVLKGTWFSFGSFKPPATLPQSEAAEDEGPEGSFLEKVALIEEGMDAIDAVFEQFLRLRVSDGWETTELPAIRRWIASNEG
jgi:hypothetical protein